MQKCNMQKHTDAATFIFLFYFVIFPLDRKEDDGLACCANIWHNRPPNVEKKRKQGEQKLL